MLKYIFKRALSTIPVLWIIITISFFMMRFAPGGPFDKDRVVPEEVKANIARKYHLDEPMHKQYARYMWDLMHFNFGPSFKYKDRTVNDIIRVHAPVSLKLGSYALLLAIAIGVPAGCIAALRQNTGYDYAAMSFAMLGVSVPNFVLASILVLVFAMKFHWFNVTGWGDWKTMVLPAVTLGLGYAAAIARLSRAGMLDIIRQDYIRTARAKGLRESVVLFRHALKGGLLPVVSYLGPATAAILTGSLVVERIFGVPGIGREFVDSALNRDYTLVLGTVILYSTVLVLLNMVVDILYAFLDPRIEYK